MESGGAHGGVNYRLKDLTRLETHSPHLGQEALETPTYGILEAYWVFGEGGDTIGEHTEEEFRSSKSHLRRVSMGVSGTIKEPNAKDFILESTITCIGGREKSISNIYHTFECTRRRERELT
jgi:hypothetical protein